MEEAARTLSPVTKLTVPFESGSTEALVAFAASPSLATKLAVLFKSESAEMLVAFHASPR